MQYYILNIGTLIWYIDTFKNKFTFINICSGFFFTS